VTDAYRFIETRRLLSFDERHARYVHVDSCCDLPMPKRDIEGEGSDARVVGLSITPWQRDFSAC